MKIQKRFLMGLLVLIVLTVIFPVSIAAETARPAVGTFANSKDNRAKNRYEITTNVLEQTVISYSKKTSWDCVTADVTGYTSDYTRLCITAFFDGSEQFDVEIKAPGKNNGREILYSEIKSGYIEGSAQLTRNADGSCTFDITIPTKYSDITSKGISAVKLFIDPEKSVSSARSMTIIDIGFRKPGEPAGPFYSVPDNYTVAVDGSDASTTGAGSYAPGAEVTISAGTRTGYTFSGWTVTSGDVILADSTSETTTFTMPSWNVAVTANWTANIILYDVAVDGSGTSTTGAGSYAPGAKVTISAGTRIGYTFSGWTVTSGDVILANATSETTTFTMPSCNVTLEANWTANTGSDRIFYVAKSGSNTTNNGSLTNPWGTIQYAIGQLKAGDTLIIREGTYNEKLSVNVSGTEGSYITIKGETGKRVILDGTGVSGGNMITLNNRNYIRIENLEICNNRVTRTNIGISISASDSSTGIQLVNNKIYNIDGESNNSGSNRNGHGIAVYGSGTSENGAIRNLLIEGNEIYNCKLGQSEAVVVNGNVTNWKIINNYIHDNDNIGIDAIGGEGTCRTASRDRARSGLIAGNVLVNNNGTNNPTYSGNGGADGIYVDGGEDIVVENNYVTGSAYGIEVGSENGSNFMPSGIIIRNNVVLGNDNAGILLGGTDGTLDVLITYNTVYQTKGRCIEANAGSGPYTIKNNTLIASRNVSYIYVRSGIGTPAYTNNIYYGGSSSRPSGDTNGQVVNTLPVANLGSGIVLPSANLDAGAHLTTYTTPFLYRVI